MAGGFSLEETREKQSPRRYGRGLEATVPNLLRDRQNSSEAYVEGAAVVVFSFFVFFVFVAFVFFVLAAVVVVVVSCANTGMASEKAIIAVNSTVRSFFILGLDLPLE